MPAGARLHVAGARYIELVNSLIHDQYFDVDEIVFDQQQGLLTIPFEFEDVSREEVVDRTWRGRPKRTRVPLFRAFLRIAAVTDWELEDTERIGTYDFNELLYEEGSKRVQVDTNIPLKLAATVSRLDVSVEMTDEQRGFRPVRHLSGGGEVRAAGRAIRADHPLRPRAEGGGASRQRPRPRDQR